MRLHVPRYAVRRHVDMGLREMRHALHSTAPAGRIYVVAGMRDSEPLKECECYSVDTYRPAGCICCASARPHVGRCASATDSASQSSSGRSGPVVLSSQSLVVGHAIRIFDMCLAEGRGSRWRHCQPRGVAWLLWRSSAACAFQPPRDHPCRNMLYRVATCVISCCNVLYRVSQHT